MSQYIGDDGKEYNTYWEMLGANEKFQNLKEQTRLLNEQNSLIANQTNAMKIEAERNRVIQEQKILSNEIIAHEKMEHDKEMRILGIFDKISLNKKYYDEFLDYLFSNNELDIIEKNNEIIEHINKLKDDIEQINDYFKKNIELDEVSRFKYYENKIKTMIENKSILEDYLVDHNINNKYAVINILNLENNSEYMKLNKSIKENAGNDKKFLIIAIVLFFSWFISNTTSDIIAQFCLISAGISLILSLYYHFDIHYIKLYRIIDPLIEKKIEELNKNIEKYNNYDYINEKLNEYILESKDKISVLELNIKNNSKLLTDLKKKWEDFVEFRKKHYDMQLESLFIDTGLEDKITKLGLDYTRLNKNNKINDGTIEDYIIYFNKNRKY